MSFDPNVYAQLAATNPAAAAQYLASTQQAAPAATPFPPAAAPSPAAQPAPQAQGQQFYQNPNAVQPQQQLARGTLEDFYNQPTGNGGGPSVTSKYLNKRAQGSWLQLEVASDVTNADVRQQTTPQGVPQTFKDGRPKFVLVVKVKVVGSSDNTHFTEFPDGAGTLWVKGVLADELRRAMAAAGDQSGYPKAGAMIVIQSAGEQAARVQGFSPTKLYKLDYAPAAGTVDPTAPAAPADVPQAAAAPAAVPPAAPAPAPAPAPTPTMTAPALPMTPGAPAAAPTNPPAPVPAAGADDSKAALLAKLSGQAG